MTVRRFSFISLAVLAFALPVGVSAEPAQLVIVATFDGLRWQEMFGGLDMRLLNDEEGGMESATDYRKRLNAETPEARREILLPFMWSVVAREGAIYGAPETNSEVVVTNAARVSYPGYNEMLTGKADPEIKSNPRVANKNVTVLEWLNNKPAYTGRIFAFGSWDLFNVIFNEERSKLPVNAGWDDRLPEHSERARAINAVVPELPRFWQYIRLDIITQTGALDALRYEMPKVVFVGYGETDDWAHDRRYDMYLDSAQRTDRYLRELWETAQSMPEFAGKTTLLVTTDHGRGDTPADWTDHSPDVSGCERIWIAAIGAGIEPQGVVKDVRLTQGQIAATVAALLGEDYRADMPDAAESMAVSR